MQSCKTEKPTAVIGSVTALSLLLTALTLVGCDPGERRYRMSGKVTFKGKPVPEGYIMMEPDASKGASGGPGRAKIIDGVYDTSVEEGMGTLGGPHRIVISGFDGKSSGGKVGMEVALPKSLFMNYTVNEDLPKQDVVKDFDITK